MSCKRFSASFQGLDSSTCWLARVARPNRPSDPWDGGVGNCRDWKLMRGCVPWLLEKGHTVTDIGPDTRRAAAGSTRIRVSALRGLDRGGPWVLGMLGLFSGEGWMDHAGSQKDSTGTVQPKHDRIEAWLHVLRWAAAFLGHVPTSSSAPISLPTQKAIAGQGRADSVLARADSA